MTKKLRAVFLSSAVLLCSSASARAQSAPAAPAAPRQVGQPLPAEWEGVWKGTLLVAHADGSREELPMELHVGPPSGGGARGWKILYAEPGGQTARPYEIAPAADEPGRFAVGEKNGPSVDNYLVGRVLHSQFLVKNSIFTARFELRGDEMAVEMSMFDASSPRQSRATGEEVAVFSHRFRPTRAGRDIAVFSYKFGSIQQGVLRRAKPKS